MEIQKTTIDGWIKASGKLLYDPPRPGLKKKHKARSVIIQPKFDDIDLYYQWFLKKRYGLRLQRPVWRPHVTIVKGNEKIKNELSWKKHDQVIIEYEYSPAIEKNFQFWTLPVRCDQMKELRRDLGLKPDFPFHITIGRLYDNH